MNPPDFKPFNQPNFKPFNPPDLYEYFYGLVKQIPEGRVSTYRALACALGECRAARAVGQMLKENPTPIVVPCHRVVMSDGTPGGYAGLHTPHKIALLEKEEVYFEGGSVRNFEERLFTDFRTDYPLKTLREEQERVAKAIAIPEEGNKEKEQENEENRNKKEQGWQEKFPKILGLDVSYRGREAQGAGVLFDNGIPVKTVKVRMKVKFPYITGFLSYREIPVYLRILEKLKSEDALPDLLMVDGNGVLHPIGCGIGAHLHYLTGIPVVGVAKSHLCGTVGEFRKLWDFLPSFSGTGLARAAEVRFEKNTTCKSCESSGELRGFACIQNIRRIKKPVFVSPGGGVSFIEALAVVAGLSGFRVPEPIRAAHRLAGEW